MVKKEGNRSRTVCLICICIGFREAEQDGNDEKAYKLSSSKEKHEASAAEAFDHRYCDAGEYEVGSCVAGSQEAGCRVSQAHARYQNGGQGVAHYIDSWRKRTVSG
jgi:hypothetical protein